MIDNVFRSWFETRAMGFARVALKLGFTPNRLSLLAFFFAISAAIVVATGNPVAGILLWWTGRFFDALDGIVARFGNCATHFGAFMDLTLDMLSYGIMVLSLGILHPALSIYWSTILVLYIGCVTSALSLGNIQAREPDFVSDGRGLRLAAGLAEGGETGIAYTLMILFPSYIQLWASLWIGTLVITILARFIQVKNIESNREKE
jgi:phosphatidylglycerophosphate synthase